MIRTAFARPRAVRGGRRRPTWATSSANARAITDSPAALTPSSGNELFRVRAAVTVASGARCSEASAGVVTGCVAGRATGCVAGRVLRVGPTAGRSTGSRDPRERWRTRSCLGCRAAARVALSARGTLLVVAARTVRAGVVTERAGTDRFSFGDPYDGRARPDSVLGGPRPRKPCRRARERSGLRRRRWLNRCCRRGWRSRYCRRRRGYRCRRGRGVLRRRRCSGRSNGKRRQEQQWIEVALWLVRAADAEVHVGHRQLRDAARADGSDLVALGDRCAAADAERAEVDQRCGVSVAGLDRQRLPGGGHGPRERHGSGHGRDHHGPAGRPEVDAAMEARAVRIGVEAKRAQDRPLHRPGPAARCRRRRESHSRSCYADRKPAAGRPYPLPVLQTAATVSGRHVRCQI
jgi:hypothetical protein